MKKQWPLFILVAVLVMFWIRPLYAEGPIYNFNFHNYASDKQGLQQTAEQPVLSKPGLNPEQTNLSSNTQDSGAQSRYIMPELFLKFGFTRGGNGGPFAKVEEMGEIDENTKNHLQEDKYEVGFGLKLTSSIDLLINGHYKQLAYKDAAKTSYIGDSAVYESKKFSGRAIGGSVGPQFKVPLSQSLTLITSTTFTFSKGSIGHFISEEIGRSVITDDTKGKYLEMGGELGLGLDIALRPSINLGLMGTYGAYKVDFKPGERTNYGGSPLPLTASPETVEIIERSKSKLQAGLNLKFLI